MEVRGQVLEVNYTQDYRSDYYVVTMTSRFLLSREDIHSMGTFPPGRDVQITFYPKIELEWPNMAEIEKEHRLKCELQKRLKRNPRMLRIGDEHERDGGHNS